MNLTEYLSKRSVGRVVVGEIYHIDDMEFSLVEDPFHRGAKRAQVILLTDRGYIWAPSGLAAAIWESVEADGLDKTRAQLIGLTMRGASYFSKNLKKDVVTLEPYKG